MRQNNFVMTDVGRHWVRIYNSVTLVKGERLLTCIKKDDLEFYIRAGKKWQFAISFAQSVIVKDVKPYRCAPDVINTLTCIPTEVVLVTPNYKKFEHYLDDVEAVIRKTEGVSTAV